MPKIGIIFYKAAACGRLRGTDFTGISIFRRSQVFFRANYFFSSPSPPVSLRVESPPWGRSELT